MKDFLKQYKIEIGIFFLALLVRCIYLYLSIRFQNGDLIGAISGADSYYTISQNIVLGHGYSAYTTAPYLLNSVRPPVFPYFLAWTYMLFKSYWTPLILQLLIGSFLPILTMRIGRYITPVRSIVVGVGIFLALEPVSILFSTFFYSETFFTLLFLVSILYLFSYLKTERFLHLLFSSVFLGFATLTKPTVTYLPALIAVVLVWHFRKNLPKILLHTVAYGALFLAVLAPWALRNYREFGVVSVSSLSGVALYDVLVPSVLSLKNGTTFATEYQAILQQGGADPNFSDVSQSREFTKRATHILLANPKPLVLILGNTALNFFIHDGMYDVLRHIGQKPGILLGKPALFVLLSNPLKLGAFILQYTTSPFILILVGRVLWISVTILAFLGIVRYIRKEVTPEYACMSGAIVLYFMLTTLVIGLTVNARYRLPVEGLIVMFAFYELIYWKRKKTHEQA